MDPRFETIQSDSDSSFLCRYYTCPLLADDHALHYHPEYELTWVIRSEGYRFVGDSIERYEPGDLVLVGPNLPHRWHNEPGRLSADDPELIVVQFERTFLGPDFFERLEMDPVRRLLDGANCGLRFDTRVANRVGELLRAMIAQRGIDRLIRLLEVLSLLANAQSQPLATRDYQEENSVNPLNRQRIELVYSYVRQNLAEEISQAAIAKQLGLTAPAFSRFFKVATGKTFVAFVNILRVNEACRLLNQQNLSVTEIAMDCGYNNISNFNRQFLMHKGMNPSEFRARIRDRDRRLTDPVALKAVS